MSQASSILFVKTILEARLPISFKECALHASEYSDRIIYIVIMV